MAAVRLQVSSVFVTGANRGLGLEFVKQLVKLTSPPKYVFATYRNKDTTGDLEEIKRSSTTSNVILIRMDVNRDEDVAAARKVVENTTKEEGLNLLINNAAVAKYCAFPDVDDENLLFHFRSNTLGPIKVLKALYPLLQKAAAAKEGEGLSVSKAAAINISSMAGSIFELESLVHLDKYTGLGYRVSKAAVNMAMRHISLQMNEQGILIVNMCPGWVRTDMGSDEGEISTEESIGAMLKTLTELGKTHQGSFLDRNGQPIPF